MSTSLSIVLAFVGCAAVLFLSSGVLIMESFTKAKIRKLRETSRQLGDILETELSRADQLRMAGHLLLAAVFAGTAYCFFIWAENGGASAASMVLILVVILLFAGLLQLISRLSGLLLSARILRIYLFLCRIVFFPLAPVFTLFSWIISRSQERYQQEEEEVRVTAEDEILSLVEDDEEHSDSVSSSQGLENDEKRMLNGVIQLDKTFVHEIMTPRVDIDARSEDSTIEDIKQAIIACGHSRIPIYKQSIDTIVGVIFAKDLLDEKRVAEASDLMELAHEPVFIPESKNVGNLMDEFRNTRNHLAIVLDEYGGTAGIVTLEDILEEIVGEIQDEYDQEEEQEAEPVLADDGSLVSDGRITIWEINQIFDLEISEEQGYDTLAGYIMASEGKIPAAGEHIVTDDLEIDILEADKRKIISLRVRKREDGHPQEND